MNVLPSPCVERMVYVLMVCIAAHTDIDECERGTATCDVSAECTNTDGNYTCSCSSGYSGNGMICIGVNTIYNFP